uniref:Uncharacterized protein n=1 Tax=Romanomermis culicivorax TaxID=13658 RepID=A0A915JFZ4_ROMCU
MLKFSILPIFFLIFRAAEAYPVSGDDIPDDTPGGGIGTQGQATSWQNAWQGAKTYFSKIQTLVGQTDQQTWMDLIGKGANFVTLLRENPDKLIEAAKTALAKAIADHLVAPNSEQAKELTEESKLVQRDVQQAAAEMRQSEEGSIQPRVLTRDD